MWFVVYFFINSTWVPGDTAHPDGWSSRYYSKDVCQHRADHANKNFKTTTTKVAMKAKCQEQRPDNWVRIAH